MKKLFLIFSTCAILSACSSTTCSSLEKNQGYVDEVSRYRQNISLKQKGETFVTYEYKDVRVDELAPLAIRYCEDKDPNKKAQLREIVLYRNNARRATFDCVNLAM